MKPLIIYYSRTGNTEKIAKAMADELDAELKEADKVDKVKERELIGLGSGIYAMKHDKRILNLVDEIPSSSKVFIFSTSGMTSNWIVNFMHSALRKKLENKGVEIIGEWNCPGHDNFILIRWLGLNKGRPNEKDLMAAENFVKEVSNH